MARLIFQLANYGGEVLAPLDTEARCSLNARRLPNGTALAAADQRYGISVEYSDGQFLFKSGQTGDQSSLEITLKLRK